MTSASPPAAPDFRALHAAMQRLVDSEFLPGISVALVAPGMPPHVHCTGWADREGDVALREEHLFRVYSNTKLVTSCAVLLLLEEGRFELSDPIERFLPALAARRVLRPDARSLDDTVPARGRITIAQLLSHSAGLSYGLLDPGSMIYKAYEDRRILSPETTLAQMVDDLAPLPLTYEPGTGWEYSIAMDVLARLVEVLGGAPFDHFVRERILEPLRMRDTGFVVPERDHERIATMYVGADLKDPMKPGLSRGDHLLPPQAHLRPVPRLNAGGGLVSSLPDMVKLLSAVLPGPNSLLKPQTVSLAVTNQLAPGCFLRFPVTGEQAGRGHGLAGGLVLTPGPKDHPESAGTLYWGGLAGTQWWISLRHGIAGALMTQRWWGFGHPLFAELKFAAYEGLFGRTARH